MEKTKKRSRHNKSLIKSPLVIVYTTFKNKTEAERICLSLVNQKLIACANLSNHTAIYNWKNKTEKHFEMHGLLKTSMSKVAAIKLFFAKHHSYSCPVLVVNKIDKINNEYKKWLYEQLS